MREKVCYVSGGTIYRKLQNEFIIIDKESKQLILKCNYNKGNLDGEYLEYYPSGYIKKRINFKNGILHGEYKWSYNPSNKICSKTRKWICRY